MSPDQGLSDFFNYCFSFYFGCYIFHLYFILLNLIDFVSYQKIFGINFFLLVVHIYVTSLRRKQLLARLALLNKQCTYGDNIIIFFFLR